MLRLASSILLFLAISVAAAPPSVPDKLVVLTFDDSVASHATVVAPLLKKLGFGATFYITEGFDFTTNKDQYMTWAQIKSLHEQGFEIGNHTKAHKSVKSQKKAELVAHLEHIEKRLAEHGIPHPTTFCYPGYVTSDLAVEVLKERGYKAARAGGARAFDPKTDNRLIIPQAFDSKPKSTMEQFKTAVAKARDGKIAVLTFHGVPDKQHPWVHTDPERFTQYMNYLKAEGYTVVAMRDIVKYTEDK
jgi:peptidoglycan/xylan/chitin deacetylase (PgdA/CDA1 family)